MAELSITNNATPYQWWPDVFDSDGPTSISQFTASAIVFQSYNGSIITIEGSGFARNGNTVTGGEVSSITIRGGANVLTLATITGIGQHLSVVYSALFGWDTPSGWKSPNGWDALSQVLSGKDKLNGSDIADTLGGYSEGNDKVYGNGGDDFLKGDRGNDKLDGGSGFDELAYDETFYGLVSDKGIKLDAAKKTVIDPWGYTDKIKNFEGYLGSGNGDVMKGSNKDEDFRGLRGEDKIDGRKGFNSVLYDRDDEYGGSIGVHVDLATGRATDGWGSVDKLKKIDGATGSRYDDVLIGNDKENILKGEDGNDTLTGGGKADIFVFNKPADSLTNHDVITDFNVGDGDKIALNKAKAFTALTSTNVLADAEFVANATGTATTSSQHIVYNTTNGNLFYDPTGSTVAGDEVLFATLTGAPVITASMFEIWV